MSLWPAEQQHLLGACTTFCCTTTLSIWMTVRNCWNPVPEMPTVVSSTLEAALKPRHQVSLGVMPKGHWIWKIHCDFPDWVPVPAKVCSYFAMDLLCSRGFIASGKACGEFHQYIQGEDTCVLYTAKTTHTTRWADSPAEL